MSINEERLKEWIEQVTKKLAHLEANQIAIINGDFCDINTEPKEPLIRDEKIRKAVRAWADGNNIESVHYDAFWRGFRRDNSSITVWEELPLEDNKVYTITELCGTPEPLEPTFIDLDERIKEKREE